MVAVLGGLGAALCFSGATLCNSRASRLLDSGSLLAWVMLVGMLIVGPLVLLEGVPDGLSGSSIGWLAICGAGNVGGLLCSYAALRAGMVGLVAPIISTEGAIAALLAIVAGEPLTAAAGAALAVIALGVALAGAAPGEPGKPARRRGEPQVVLLASAAAVAFGASLYATGRVGNDVPVVWALLPPRLIGTVAIAAPLILGGRLRLTRRALPFVVASGCFEGGRRRRLRPRLAPRHRGHRRGGVAVRGDLGGRGLRALPRAAGPRPDGRRRHGPDRRRRAQRPAGLSLAVIPRSCSAARAALAPQAPWTAPPGWAEAEAR